MTHFRPIALLASAFVLGLVALQVSSAVGASAASGGSLDVSFGKHGVVRTKVAEDAVGWAMAIQHDKRIVVAGLARKGNEQVGVLVRYRPNGTLDPSFGNHGRVVIGFGWVFGLAIQGDGKLLVAGGQGNGDAARIMLARYRSNGTLDQTFASNGVATTPLAQSASADAIAVQPDGRIIVAGGATVDGGLGFALVRYRRNGSLDTSFGQGGHAVTSFAWNAGATAVLVQPNGKIVAAGTTYCGHYCTWIALARYDRGGALDHSFGSGGTTTGKILNSDSARAIARQRDGRLLVAGSTNQALAAGYSLLVRFTQRGKLDTTFNKTGTAVLDFGQWSFADAVVVQPDGKIVTAGGVGEGDGVDLLVARYGRQGSLDPNFGRGGIVTTNLTSGDDLANAVALQRNGKIVVAGGADQYGPTGGGILVARFRR